MRAPRLLVMLAVVACAPACRKTAEEQKRASEQATAVAEEKAKEATLTSATLDDRESAAKANEDAMRERAEAITATRREQVEARGKLQAALDALDREIASIDADRHRGRSRSGPAHRKALEGRREVLKHHLDALDRTNDHDWAALRARIDADLQDPARVEHAEPRSDRPYGQFDTSPREAR